MSPCPLSRPLLAAAVNTMLDPLQRLHAPGEGLCTWLTGPQELCPSSHLHRLHKQGIRSRCGGAHPKPFSACNTAISQLPQHAAPISRQPSHRKAHPLPLHQVSKGPHLVTCSPGGPMRQVPLTSMAEAPTAVTRARSSSSTALWSRLTRSARPARHSTALQSPACRLPSAALQSQAGVTARRRTRTLSQRDLRCPAEAQPFQAEPWKCQAARAGPCPCREQVFEGLWATALRTEPGCMTMLGWLPGACGLPMSGQPLRLGRGMCCCQGRNPVTAQMTLQACTCVGHV